MASKPCAAPGCPALTKERYCIAHKAEHRKHTDARRGSSASRGYGGKWQKARLSYLSRNPLCRLCAAQGRTREATVVDHIKPHKGDQSLFWSESNWQPLCKYHHDVKTSTEDGGYGRG